MEIIVRATVIYFFLLLLTRGLGKRELAQMSAFELLLLVTVGDLVQQGATQEDMSLTGAMLSVGTIGAWIGLFGYVSFRFPATRDLLEGVPVVVVHDGRILSEALVNERVPIEELLGAAREQGIGDLADVRVGVLEPDGQFTFIRMSEGDDEG